MGDIVSLVEKAAENFDQAQAQRMAEKMRKGKFDLEDLRDQLAQMEKIGGIGGMLGHAAGHRQDEVAARERQSRRPGHQAPARHHRFHDARPSAATRTS